MASQQPDDMRVIGLTGGIGTGKSEVSNILAELGAKVIDADLLGHEIYRPHTEGWREVREAFGEGVLRADGEVDRKRLGDIVFNDAKALTRLNAITHPRIYKLIAERIESVREKGTGVVVVEAALLLEAGWTSLVDEVWVTVSHQEQVFQRIRARTDLDDSAIRARIESQMSDTERTERPDVAMSVVIDNNGSLEQLRKRIEALWRSRALAHKEIAP